MSSFPNSPQVQKGAIVAQDRFTSRSTTIIFQYNPEKLTRTLTAQTVGGEGAAQGEALRFKGPPQEIIKLDVDINAADQLERADGLAMALGIHPALAALEMLLYPKSSVMIANEVLARAGMIEIIPAEAPLTLFFWGQMRVMPVRVTTFSITEEAFDVNLNPILAKVSLDLTVLTYQDLGMFTAGGGRFLSHHINKEVLAAIGNGIG